jgi:hypothetical protein
MFALLSVIPSSEPCKIKMGVLKEDAFDLTNAPLKKK